MLSLPSFCTLRVRVKESACGVYDGGTTEHTVYALRARASQRQCPARSNPHTHTQAERDTTYQVCESAARQACGESAQHVRARLFVTTTKHTNTQQPFCFCVTVLLEQALG